MQRCTRIKCISKEITCTFRATWTHLPLRPAHRSSESWLNSPCMHSARARAPGMHPHASAVLSQIDNLAPMRRVAARVALLSACGVAGYVWYTKVYCLPKLQYNDLHPYTSWIPITLFIVVRNLTPNLRLQHLRLFGWLGCITLETYIGRCRLHSLPATCAGRGPAWGTETAFQPPQLPVLHHLLETNLGGKGQNSVVDYICGQLLCSLAHHRHINVQQLTPRLLLLQA